MSRGREKVWGWFAFYYNKLLLWWEFKQGREQLNKKMNGNDQLWIEKAKNIEIKLLIRKGKGM